jgi:citrate lyase subunit beta/citryl-CoA lyase
MQRVATSISQARIARAQPLGASPQAPLGAEAASKVPPGRTKRAGMLIRSRGSDAMNTTLLTEARTFLFVPGNRPERFAKAAQSGADAVVLDLEDSVPDSAKPAAREAVAAQWSALQRSGIPLVVRINALGSEAAEGDLASVAHLSRLGALMVPKAESPDALADLHHRLGGPPLVPLVESAAGFDALKAIAAAAGVLRLAVGHIDFLADTGMSCDEDESELAPLRFAVAMATRLYGLAPAIDGVTVQTDDEERLRTDTLRARRFGFGAKLCIHPRQVAVVHEAFAPSPAECEWARRVVEADRQAGGAAVRLDGRMVDKPVVLQAQRILARGSQR